MSTTGLIVDEVDGFLEEVKGAIRRKVSREVSLQQNIDTDRILAKARYLSDNERGALLSMRRIHKHTTELQRVAATCAKLLQLQKSLEASMARAARSAAAATGITHVDLGDLQDTLEQILSDFETTEYTRPSDDQLRPHLRKLAQFVEI